MNFISRKELAARRSVSLSTQKQLELDPRHPLPVEISPRRVAFIESEIDEYDAKVIAARRVERSAA